MRSSKTENYNNNNLPFENLITKEWLEQRQRQSDESDIPSRYINFY